MQLTDGEFEGYLPPTEDDVARALARGMVVLDTNVLLGLYDLPARARQVALDCLRSLGERLWIPHQVAREFWRNRPGRLSQLKTGGQAGTLDGARGEVAKRFREAHLDGRMTPEAEEALEAIREKLTELEREIKMALAQVTGDPFNTRDALRDPRLDPVVTELLEILDDRVGHAPSDEAEMIAEGLRRFTHKRPPGFEDAEKKKDQIPERGTGDYLLWEQTLRHLDGLGVADPFVIVSQDEKKDWRTLIEGKTAVAALPALVAEARDRVGQPVYVISAQDFYEQLAGQAEGEDADAVETLIATAANAERDTADDWTQDSFNELLARLEDEGYPERAEVIRRGAAAPDHFVSRGEVYQIAGYDDTRSLRRFSMPVQRITVGLVEDGLLAEDSEWALWAEYAGPGQATGFSVPETFGRFVESLSEPTWLEAAYEAAEQDPAREWTARELVQEIERLGLKPSSRGRTPEATLRRDLAQRQNDYFARTEDGKWCLLRQ